MPELHPLAFTNRLSIRSNHLIGPDSVHPESTERMAMIYNPREPYVPDNAVTLPMMPNLKDFNADDLTERNRHIFTGRDETTKRRVILYCLHGPYADRLCRAQVFEGPVGYDFFIPFRKIAHWGEATDRVKALFESLQVTPLQ